MPDKNQSNFRTKNGTT